MKGTRLLTLTQVRSDTNPHSSTHFQIAPYALLPIPLKKSRAPPYTALNTCTLTPKQESTFQHNRGDSIKIYESYMLTHKLHHKPGSHFMIVDSGTPIHIVYDHLFVSNTREGYTPVAGFSGNASRVTHRGDLNKRVHTNNNEYINLVDTDDPCDTRLCPPPVLSKASNTQKGYKVQLDSTKPGIWICKHFIPFVNDPETNLWILPLYPSTQKDNGLYPMPSDAVATAPTSTAEIPDELHQLREEWMLMQHHRLGHPSQDRQTALEIEGLAKAKVPKLVCPTCLASKARKSNRLPANSKEERSTVPWEDIHSDLSDKISTQSARGYKYFVVFICTATGAKHVEFLSHKSHFINAYRRLVIELGAHPKMLRTDQGTQYTLNISTRR
jgi:hypothetical protein